jgi:hypothetical protein
MPAPIPPDLSPDAPAEATTYFELERRRAADGTKLGGEPLTTPLPATSPWSGANPGPGAEPLIEGDSNTMDVPIDLLNR